MKRERTVDYYKVLDALRNIFPDVIEQYPFGRMKAAEFYKKAEEWDNAHPLECKLWRIVLDATYKNKKPTTRVRSYEVTRKLYQWASARDVLGIGGTKEIWQLHRAVTRIRGKKK
jgi:hypothetical protein